MDFNSNKTQWARWLFVVFIIIIGGYLGVDEVADLEIPPPPVDVIVAPAAPPDNGGDIAYGYQTKVYLTDGGDKQVVASGGEIEILSGGTLDVQSSATSTFGGDLSVTGALDVSGAATLNSTLDVDGNITSGTSAVTVTDNVLLDGAADAIQLTVQGYTTQTSSLQVWEQSDGTDVGSLSNAGALDVASTINYGTANLYPLGYGLAGYEMYCGTSATITNTLAITSGTHGLATSILAATCSLGTDPGTGAGDVVACSVSVATTTATVKGWQDDWSAAANAWTVYYCIVGVP